jgi:hypothetical protein
MIPFAKRRCFQIGPECRLAVFGFEMLPPIASDPNRSNWLAASVTSSRRRPRRNFQQANGRTRLYTFVGGIAAIVTAFFRPKPPGQKVIFHDRIRTDDTPRSGDYDGTLGDAVELRSEFSRCP